MEIFIDVVSALIFIVVGFYITRYLEKRHLPKIAIARQKAITGKWHGVYRQEPNDNREGCELSINLDLNAGPRSIIGTMSVSEDVLYEFNIEGSFYHNKYLRINYTASGKTESAVDFGSIFLVLGDFPNKMSGKLAGYGSVSEALITGGLTIEKNNNAN